MNRYGRRKIILANEQLAAHRISGVYSTGDSDAFAQSVAALLAARVAASPEAIVLSSPNSDPFATLAG